MSSEMRQYQQVFESALLKSLASLCSKNGLEEMSDRLTALVKLVATDLLAFELEWRKLQSDRDVVTKAASQLIALSGKRLRPLCVLLAAHCVADASAEAPVGVERPDCATPSDSASAPASVDATTLARRLSLLSLSVELVHCATLLHDDVIDQSDLRRGHPTSRVTYGNAAAIFGGDWLLTAALKRVALSGVDGLLYSLLNVIEEMIEGEAIQLENAGSLSTSRETYFRIIDGKTGALFRWGMYAGARAGGATSAQAEKLALCGQNLGRAFQLMDDLLDLRGDPSVTGKPRYADLKEGKLTYPIIISLEQEPSLEATLRTIRSMRIDQELPLDVVDELNRILEKTDAITKSHSEAVACTQRAMEALAQLPDGPGRKALETVVQLTLARGK